MFCDSCLFQDKKEKSGVGVLTELDKVSEPAIVFFDMDYTILQNDCDVLWKNFLVDQGLAPVEHKERALYFLNLHQKGKLPVVKYVLFQMKEFSGNTPQKMRELSQHHFDLYVKQFLYPQAKSEVLNLKKSGAAVVLLTGTNEVISAPIAEHFGFTDLIATRLELADGKYTGKVAGDFLIREKKMKGATEYCRKKEMKLSEAAFYADSVNDIFLLECVGQATVVNPNKQLKEIARMKNWKTIFWSL